MEEKRRKTRGEVVTVIEEQKPNGWSTQKGGSAEEEAEDFDRRGYRGLVSHRKNFRLSPKHD